MTRRLRLVLVLALSLPAAAQGERVTAAEALTAEQCKELVDRAIPRIEAYTRLKFRRPVPIYIQPYAVWDAGRKASGFAGFTAKHAVAFYRPGLNDMTVIPWNLQREGEPDGPIRKTREQWLVHVEPTLIHEMTHALHHQNFYTEGRNHVVSQRENGLSEPDIDSSTVDFLIGEGYPELVALRTSTSLDGMFRQPARLLDSPRALMQRYIPDGQRPFRILLSERGYQDGLNLMHHLAMKGGMRAVRAVLYRPPHRSLLFKPELLGSLDLDDPPEPDAVFGVLHPGALSGDGVLLAVNPGRGDYFETAAKAEQRREGCLLGYTARARDGGARYSFFVADPDSPGQWQDEQVESLRALHPAGLKEKKVPLPLADGVEARLIEVRMEDSSRFMRGDASGLVVMVHESKPTERLEERVLAALRVLHVKRPTPKLYDEAVARMRGELGKDFTAADKQPE